ncbi:hypothetical protein ABZ479_21340 [Streptomyces sp. NPDC005722]
MAGLELGLELAAFSLDLHGSALEASGGLTPETVTLDGGRGLQCHLPGALAFGCPDRGESGVAFGGGVGAPCPDEVEGVNEGGRSSR